MKETWYVMEDGTPGDPREIRPDSEGVLRHKDGRAVAYAPHGPRSRSVDPSAMRAKAPSRDMTADDDKPASDDREMKPTTNSGKGYRTRGTKAE